MPYITEYERNKLNPLIEPIIGDISTAGRLDYVITVVCLKFLARSTESFTAISEVIGILESTKLEFFRRKLVPHETKKIEQNGDVYYI